MVIFVIQKKTFMNEFMQIFTLVTGILYIILEIRQKNSMWVVGIVTGLAAMVVFFLQGLYASMGLNVYYVAVSFWGLYCWRRDKKKMRSEPRPAESIYLNPLPFSTVLFSVAIFAACLYPVTLLLTKLADPMPWLDSGVTIASAIATYWLSRSYSQQWLIWIVADFATAMMCYLTGQYWMTALYVVYSLSAIYGFFHWRRFGVSCRTNL